MELDKRIKDIIDIQTCITFDEKYIGKKGYFCDEFCNLTDLNHKCVYGTLISIDTHAVSHDLCFKGTLDEYGYHNYFRFFVPEETLNPVEPEKKYRPFTLVEWIDQHEIGEVIHYRSKLGETESRQMYVGTRQSSGIKKNILKISLGEASHTLDYLFENYEIEVDGEWLPFGVIDKGE